MEPKTKIGDRYGHLVVIGEAEKESNGQLRYKCQCDCGNIIITRGTRLRNGERKVAENVFITDIMVLLI